MKATNLRKPIKHPPLLLLVSLLLVALVATNHYVTRVLAQEEGPESPAEPEEIVTLNAIADTTIFEDSPDLNLGSGPILTVERDDFLQQSIALVQFDVSAIPPGSTINSATLWMRLDAAYVALPTVDISAGPVTEPWVESTATWNNQPAWDCCTDTTPVGNIPGEYAAWDLTALVDDWVNDPATVHNYGVALTGPATGHHRAFASRESIDAPPYISVDVTLPPPDGAITASMLVAEASLPNQDDPSCYWPPFFVCFLHSDAPEDFYTRISANGGPLIQSATIPGRSLATWDPPFTVSAPVLKALRTYPVRVELWEDDDGWPGYPDIEYDINPGPARSIDATYDGCTQTWTIDGTEYGPGPSLVPAVMVRDVPGAAQVTMNIANIDGKSFAPNDVSIVDIQPVQVIYEATAMVADKATSMMLDLSSTWSVTRTVNIYTEMSDGLTTVSQVKTVAVPPEGARVFFFDGSDGVPPYMPAKNPDDPLLRYKAQMTIDADEGDPDWQECVDVNNEAEGSISVLKTHNPEVVYQPWDFNDGSSMPLPAAVVNTRAANEPFRLATFPISNTVSSLVAPRTTGFGLGTIAICELFPLPTPELCLLASTLPVFSMEPGQTLFWENQGAALAGIERMVLMPSAMFWENETAAGRLTSGTPSTIGLSMGEFGPRVVIAEAGTSQTVVHELAHTYALSYHNCTNGGIMEDFFLAGCMDEYLFAPGDGAPFPSFGFDVNGMVYPTGMGGVPGTRELMGVTNIMDTTGAPNGTYDRWIDLRNYNFLLGKMRDKQDPVLVNVSGFIWVENGLAADDSSVRGVLTTNYQFDGFPDIPQPELDEPSGYGYFSARLETPQGERIYRFNPQFESLDYDGQTYGDYAFFSFAVLWEPDMTGLSLWGPAGPLDADNYAEVQLFHKTRSAHAPEVHALTVSVNGVPIPQNDPPPPVTIGDEVTLSWETSDVDGDELHTTLLLGMPGSSGGYDSWLPYAVELEGNSFTIPVDWLLSDQGLYDGRIVVSDGLTSTTYDQADLFQVMFPESLYMPVIKND